MNFSNLLKFDYWFEARTIPLGPVTLKILLVILLAALILAIIISFRKAKIKEKLENRLFGKLANWLYSLSIVGLIFLFFRQQSVPYLGMRFLIALWFLICLVWLIFILRFIIVKIPKIKEEKQKKLELEKYLPK